MKFHPPKWSARQSLALVLALALGTALHDLFKWFPSILTEFFAPVNESLWEHVKLIYWPLLLTLPLAFGKGTQAQRLAAPMVSSVLMLALAWLYHVHLGGEAVAVDVLIFVLVIVLGFLFCACVTLPRSSLSLLSGLTVIWVALLLAFTINPPNGLLFRDASLVDAWVRVLC